MGGTGGRSKLTYLKFHDPDNIFPSAVIDPSYYGASKILKTTTGLVTLKLFFDVAVVESCNDIIEYREVSMDTVSSVNKVLRSCPVLRRLSMHGDHFSQPWFHLFEPQWDAPKLESLKYKARGIVKKRVIDYASKTDDLGDIRDLDMKEWRLRHLLSALEGLMGGDSQSFTAGSEHGSAPDIYDTGLDVGLPRPAVDILIGVLERYYERERQLVSSIKDNSWRISGNYNKLDTNLDVQHFRGLFLDTALAIPTLKTVRFDEVIFDRV
ncbi:hypothetical protein BGZ94_003368 [Podila epigama]|nr:hypothetical protein BGZ94_003368 [Podila epigama]